MQNNVWSKSDNRMLTVISELLSVDNVPTGAVAAINAICQLYHFDRVSSYIREVGTDHVMPLHEFHYGKEVYSFVEEGNLDFDKAYYRKIDESVSSVIMDTLVHERFIHTKDFQKYQSDLETIGFRTNKEATSVEVCMSCVCGVAVGMMGYFVFEKMEGSNLLDEQELFEIKNLVEIIIDRIEKFEITKKLRDEELLNAVDFLTGLDVYSVFADRAKALLETKQLYAMVYLDIDKFKYINHNWGFEVGNEILVKVAQVLKNSAGEKDCYCRIGDDKFGFLTSYNSDEELLVTWEQLSDQFDAMQKKYFSDVKITMIAGLYVTQPDDISVSLVVDKANIARRSIKGAYKNTAKMYNHRLHEQTEQEKQFEKQMMIALENGEFIPFLQPKFHLETNEICGAEALARWQTAERLISPMEFIPVFERNGFITRLDFIIYEEVFRFIREGLEKGYDMYPISLNVSREHIHNATFLDELLELMEQYKVPHRLVELEITESVFSEDNEVLKNFVGGIREHEITVSIDDFGTAYSSLNMLKDVVVDTIKMDKTFIDNLTNDSGKEVEKDKIIIKNIVSMINELNFDTVFEGVETTDHVDFLKEIGCDVGQGYIFAKPMPLQEFEKMYLLK